MDETPPLTAPVTPAVPITVDTAEPTPKDKSGWRSLLLFVLAAWLIRSVIIAPFSTRTISVTMAGKKNSTRALLNSVR